MKFKEFLNKNYFKETTRENFLILQGILIYSFIFLILSMILLVVVGKNIIIFEQKVHIYNYEVGNISIQLEEVIENNDSINYIISVKNKQLKVPRYLYVFWGLCVVCWFMFVGAFGNMYDKYKKFQSSEKETYKKLTKQIYEK